MVDASAWCAIHAALTAAMRHRPARDHDGPHGWIAHERTVVADAANQWAAAHGITCTLTAADVEAVESAAIGHSDYARKFALYVADLIPQEAIPHARPVPR